MKYLEYPLFAEGYVNRFLTAGVFTELQQFDKATLHGRVNEWLKKGFAIHENPCRKEFVRKRQEKKPDYLELDGAADGKKVEVFGQTLPLVPYFPFGNTGVDASGFYYRPTWLRMYNYVLLEAEADGDVEFELETCGGAAVWVNGTFVADFTPFTRNMVKRTTIVLPLKAGRNRLLVCLDDLAERDTDYYFRMKRLGDAALTMLVPVRDEVDPSVVGQLENMLEQMYFDKEAYISEMVKLNITNPFSDPLSVTVAVAPGEFIEKMEGQESLIRTFQYEMGPDQKALELFHSDELPPGYCYFTECVDHQGISLKRKIGNQLVRKEFLEYHEPDLEERKRHILRVIVEYAPENTYKAAALLTLDGDTEAAERILLEELPGVWARKDCSDFHFIIMLYIYRTFQERLSEKMREELEKAMCGFRYWIDEPGDDVMWFFSENHALLFHCCQYLAGSFLPDRIFTCSGKTGRAVSARGEELLREWFEGFFEEFITEWNSNAYIPVDVLGLGTLYNLTEPGSEFHQKAKRALDMIFYSLRVNAHKGAVMTSFGRSYEKEMKGNYNAGTTSLLYLAYGDGYLNRACNGCIPLALGDYAAPEEYRAYGALKDNQELYFMNTQGFEKHVNLYLYKNAYALLSTAAGFKPFQKGYQEHIVQAVIDELAQVFVNHPGESFPYGSGRPNFWAGNGILPLAVQYRNTAILRYRIGEEERIDYTHAYIPISAFTRYLGEDGVIALEKDGAYIAVKAMKGLSMQKEGPNRFREFISRGRDNVWIIRVGRMDEYGDLDALLAAFKKIEIRTDGEETMVKDEKGTEFLTGPDFLLKVNGVPVYDYPLNVEGKLNLEEWDRG
ncbi:MULTISPECIES: hypothetical protein [Hungatella]|uniref:Uncharacterized protein n=1 Tax=Hungatella hathewayi TaxID=154046 RepID=A0AA37JHC8_9FIRM|nr:hypothetical protein [Hungatella hathewayi]MBT9798320.1 hypothetical protein [Hungatella hathewayi]RGZ03216.1 hypothetical protein DXA14_17155 [Hungatella hathewayi]GKH01184.1 hypothetical protein CE91St55_31650 [Hungatella hathewayi]GKH10660.1 hypothetical protein CE91St54_57680 [Hungatella hathewayi]